MVWLDCIYNYNFSEAYPEVNSHPISIIFISIKTKFYVVLLYNFKIIFYDKHFEKHATELISFKIQCFDSNFVDKLFKSVFKSWRFEKHATKSYFKINTINCKCTYLSAFVDKIIIEIGHELT